MRFDFEWDSRKSRRNVVKHGIAFEQACRVFKDPQALSVFDGKHSSKEDRWATVGISSTGRLPVVHHTYVQVDAESALIRVISCRKATKPEQGQYTG